MKGEFKNLFILKKTWKTPTQGAETNLALIQSTIVFLVGNLRFKASKLNLIFYDFYQKRAEEQREIRIDEWAEIIKISQDKNYFTKSYLFDELKNFVIAYLER